MQWIICYDISHSGRRSQTCCLLRQYALGYQKSGFEIPAPPPAELRQLTRQLSGMISDDDSLLIFRHSGTGPDWQLGCAPKPDGGLMVCL